MIPRALLLAAMPGSQLRGDWPESLTGVAIDTRALQPGMLFVALAGSRVDGHAYLAQARAAGAGGAVVNRVQDDPLPQWVVSDTEVALQQLARHWREHWGASAAAQGARPVLALTGSNGKTTTKDMLATMLRQGAPGGVTQGNLNNHLGVPLTLLGLREEHQWAVVEMGANHAGEIAAYCEWARPDVGLVTMAGPAHLEGFGSLDGVAHAKGEIFSGLRADGVAVINADDRYAELWRGLAGARRRVEFGREADVRASAIRTTESGSAFTLHVNGGEIAVQLPVMGLHNVTNALAAAAMASTQGVTVEQMAQGLAEFVPAGGRLRRLRLPGGQTVLDDSYNANPASVQAAIATLATLPGPRLLCLGDMAELGPDAARWHAEMGADARAKGIDAVWACGALAAEAAKAFGADGRTFADVPSLVAALLGQSRPFASILVKGSRSAGMDRVVAAMQSEPAHA